MRYKRGKVFAKVLLALLLCFGLLSHNTFAASLVTGGEDGDYGPDTVAESYCVMDGNTGELILWKNKDKRQYPASTTKVMTALLVLEHVPDLNAQITFSKTAVAVEASSSTLPTKAVEGEIMTVRDALYGMMLASANECGAMLGEYVAGSKEAFADMMNEKAKELGANNTHFTNAYGIHDENHYTTAYDMCLIFREVMKNQTFRTIDETVRYTIPATNKCGERTLEMTHQMLNGTIPEEGVIGGKTGRTPQAGRTLLTAVDRDGLYTISMLMKSSDESYYNDEEVLLEYAYGLHDGSLPAIHWDSRSDQVTATGNVKMRFSPSVKSNVFSTLKEGGTVERLGVYEGWSRISFEDNVYYVASEYLVSDSPEPSTEAKTTAEKTTESTTEVSTTATEEASVVNGDTQPTQGGMDDHTQMIVIIALGVGIVVVSIAIIAVLIYMRKQRKKKWFG